MLYLILKKIFQLAFKIYFRQTRVHYTSSIDTSKPTLFVANHQSGIMDALLIGSQVPQALHFMSRGESFGNRFKIWLYGLLNMHPIYRKEFTPEKAHLNHKMMAKFRDILAGGESLLIFPEGISRTEPRMRKIKTGAARVVLATEALNLYQLGVQLIPVGINYSNPHEFRSEVQINVGTPINLSAAIQLHQQEQEREAVQHLTLQIEEGIKALTIEIQYPELDEVVESVDQICREELIDDSSALEVPQRELKLRQEVIAAIGYYYQYAPPILHKMKRSLSSYHHQLNDLGLDEPRFQRLFKTKGWQLLLHLLVSPIHLYSLINAMAIVLGSYGLTKLCLTRPDFKGSLQLGFGVLCGFIFLPLQIGLCYFFSASLLLTIVYSMSLLCCFAFSLRYLRGLQLLGAWLKLMLGSFEHWLMISQLAERREVLRKELKLFWFKYHQQKEMIQV